ncbi:MAG: hypothetical protein DHS20C09_17530 [marine bacterium B5-7]|nr:MAG: hypothetical protein DHS20C09_17530 [marine bacterium B5-7]
MFKVQYLRNTHVRDLSKLIILAILSLAAMPAMSGVKFEHSDTVWLSIGGGARMQLDSRKSDLDDNAEVSFDSIRVYIAGQLHKYLKFSINTDKQNHDSTDLIDAMLRFELHPSFNLWVGRLVVPGNRIGMSGPFYGMNWIQYRQPLYPTELGGAAGSLGRGEGGVFWGTTGKFHYALGIVDGLKGFSNQSNNKLYAARLTYNFLNVESNFGYYTSSTYFGEQGNLFTVALTLQNQDGGSGSAIEQGDYFGYSIDLLSENVLPGIGVITLEAEYKDFDADYSSAAPPAAGLSDCFCLFDGDSVFATLSYLYPEKIGFGKFQPYFRYVENNPSGAASSDSIEFGTNYIISGHKAKLNLSYVSGDTNASGYAGRDVDKFTFGVQVQY